MAELSPEKLLRDWEKRMEAVLAAAAGVAGRSELPRQLGEQMQRQLELFEQLIERERRMQAELMRHLVTPFDAVFDLLEESAATLTRQAEAVEAAGTALEETARLMKAQAELFERTIGSLREPAELAKAAAGLERRSRPAAKRSPVSKRSPAGKRKKAR